MKKTVFVSLIFMVLSLSVFSQDYSTGIGLRGSFTGGITLKQFISETHALEGLLEIGHGGLGITGLYEVHSQIEVERLNWYWGFGAHIGFWEGDGYHNTTLGADYTVLGADGILGIEYTFTEVPVVLGLDWKPVINLFGFSGFWGNSGALSIRYILNE